MHQFINDIRNEFRELVVESDNMMEELRQLFNDRSLAKRNYHFELFIAILIVASCALYVALTYNLAPVTYALLYALETLIILFFSVEYALRVYFAPNRRSFVLSWYGITDILAIIPFWLGIFFPFLYGFEYLRALRLFKWNAFITRYLSQSHLDMAFAARIVIARMVAPIIVLVLITASLILEVESGSNPKIQTFGDSLYFTVTTVSTVGYGDITVTTSLGRIISMITMLISFGLIPFFLAYSMRLYFQYAGKTDAPCRKCGLRFHDYNARYCKHCGEDVYRTTDPDTLE